MLPPFPLSACHWTIFHFSSNIIHVCFHSRSFWKQKALLKNLQSARTTDFFYIPTHLAGKLRWTHFLSVKVWWTKFLFFLCGKRPKILMFGFVSDQKLDTPKCETVYFRLIPLVMQTWVCSENLYMSPPASYQGIKRHPLLGRNHFPKAAFLSPSRENLTGRKHQKIVSLE